MLQVGRRIVYNKFSGKVIIDMGEYQGDVLPRDPIEELSFLDLPYGQNKEEFNKAKEYHINIETKEVVFDSFYKPMETEEEKLKNELLKTQAEVVDLKYKEVLNNKNLNEKEGK